MGKFKKAMKAIGGGLAVMAVAVEKTTSPKYWYAEASKAAERGDYATAERYARLGIGATTRYRY